MRVRSTLLAALAVVSATTSAFGQTSTTTTPANGGPVAAPSPAPSLPRISIDGSTAGFRYRNQHNNANAETIDTTQVLLDMQVRFAWIKTTNGKSSRELRQVQPSFNLGLTTASLVTSQ